jgi:transposase
VSDATSPIDPVVAARLTELEELIARQEAALAAERAALEAERALRADAEAERDRLREAYQALQLEVELARRRLVVAKAERVDTTQLELEFAAKLAALDALAGMTAGDANADPTTPSGRKRLKGRGRRDLHKAPIGEERLEVTDPVLEDSAERIGFEESCELVWRRGGFVRLVIARVKYRTTSIAPERADETGAGRETGAGAEPVAGIATAAMPPRLLTRSYATPSLVAHIAADKFCDGLPLNRQEDRFERLGVPIHRSTMCRWLEEVGAVVGATIVEAMRREALATAFCIATDATGILVQPTPRPDGARQPCRRAHFFVQIADADHVFFEYTPVETSVVVSELFRGFSGFVQADAKSVYDVLYRPAGERDRVDGAVRYEVGCWSHYLESGVIRRRPVPPVGGRGRPLQISRA